jgi:hypothetical protein
MLGRQVSDILDVPLTFEQGIEETDEQVLVHLSTKQLLETEVSVRVNVLLHHSLFLLFHISSVLQSYKQIIIDCAKVIRFRDNANNYSLFLRFEHHGDFTRSFS